MKLNIFSFFAGAGFLDLGFEDAGFDVRFVNEAYAPFLKTYHYARASMGNKKKVPQYGEHLCSVEKFLGERQDELKSYIDDARQQGLVGFIGGPPCPDFSVAGKNAGATGKHGNLSQVYVDLICQQQPDFFLFENVKGLISTKAHKLFFNSLLIQLMNAGYSIDWTLQNAIEYGVPQDRERVIMVGFLVTPLQWRRKFAWQTSKTHPLSVLNKKDWPDKRAFVEDDDVPLSSVYPELTVQDAFERNNVLNHPNSNDFFKAKSPKIWQIDEGDVSRKCFKRLHRWRYSPTACYGNNEVHLHPYKARRLSVAEALAIQSLPKDFSLPVHDMSLTDKFKTVGNGVPYLMAKGIAKSIKEYLSVII